jgi:DNA-binding NtrC family response regulator
MSREKDSHGRPELTQTLITGQPVRNASPLGAILRVLDAPATPARFHLRAGVCSIGSADDCDVVVRDATISRQHVELELRPEGVAARDLASRNGTFYLGQRVERMILALGSRITIGRTTLAIDADTDELDQALAYNGTTYGGMIGATPVMQRLFALLSRLEGTLVSVLVDGESGVGKEVVARALHERSKLANGPFVTVNCGALARELVASELFGHRRGAFTGAHESRKGAFEIANGGTLFLDEIGELPLDIQPILLRALESGEIQPVGAETKIQVRVRVVSATNRDLASEVAAGRFREDLFYRLAVVRLTVPPLRERLDDIVFLANRFAADHELSGLPSAVVEALMARTWPGNVRELRNVISAYAALGVLPPAVGRQAEKLDNVLEGSVDLAVPYMDQKDGLVDRFTALYLRALIASSNGNQSEAARISGLDRTYLRRLLAKHGLLRGR